MTTYAWTDAEKFILREWGLMDPSDAFIATTNIALGLPAVTNNFKEMIHGIHAGRDRVVPFQNARDRTTVKVLLDFRRMDFPGVPSDCDRLPSPARTARFRRTPWCRVRVAERRLCRSPDTGAGRRIA